MELVPVMTVGDAVLATIVKGVLEQAGIEAMIDGGGAAGAYPTPTASSPAASAIICLLAALFRPRGAALTRE